MIEFCVDIDFLDFNGNVFSRKNQVTIKMIVSKQRQNT